MAPPTRMPANAVSIALLIASAAADCAFRQDCLIGSTPGCRPVPREPGDTKPAPYNGIPLLNVCPQYSEVCCTAVQMQTLYVNFMGIYSAFGDISGGGCPACYQNVVNFWCAYTCSPNQTDFVKVLGVKNVTDPVSGKLTEVLVNQMTLDPSYACAAYGTCKDTGKVKEFAPLQTCEGFFAYQGQTEAINDGHNFIDFVYKPGSSSGGTNGSGSISMPVYSCCNYPSSIDPYAPASQKGLNVSCPCATCSGMCAGGSCEGGGDAYPGLGVVDNDVMKAFNGTFVAAFYGATFAAAVIIVLARRRGFLGGAKPRPDGWAGRSVDGPGSARSGARRRTAGAYA